MRCTIAADASTLLPLSGPIELFGGALIIIGLFTRWMRPWPLLAGWAAGMISGTWMVASLHLKSSVYPLHIFGQTYAMYAAVPALILNLAVSAVLTLILRATNTGAGTDLTHAEDYA